jgi:membrane protein implicated in regulation of membrane protease activity
MRWIKTICKEGYGLFVDDGGFASAILAWIGLVKIVLSRTLLLHRWQGVVLFAGLVTILVASAVRFSRRNTIKTLP